MTSQAGVPQLPRHWQLGWNNCLRDSTLGVDTVGHKTTAGDGNAAFGASVPTPLVISVVLGVATRLHPEQRPKEVQIMPNVAVQKVNGTEKRLPIFDEIAKRFEDVRHRAFELFERRGCEAGRGLDDWLKAEREILGSPAAELAEKDGAYELQVALPGFDAKDVEVTATATEIIVHASSSQEKKSEKDDVLWTEFASSDVYRHLPIPNPIDADKTTATLEKGLLRVTAPKAIQAEKPSSTAKAA
jgi:HSP20 family protein